MQIENLKAALCWEKVTIRQKASAVNELKSLIKYVNELEKELELHTPKTLGESESIGVPYKQDVFFSQNKTIEQEKEQVNSPKHYNAYEIETIEMMKRIWGIDKTITFCIMNAFKYRMRVGMKDDIKQDLKKEQWYLNKIKELKKEKQKKLN